jgi:hypothetical protein
MAARRVALLRAHASTKVSPQHSAADFWLPRPSRADSDGQPLTSNAFSDLPHYDVDAASIKLQNGLAARPALNNWRADRYA